MSAAKPLPSTTVNRRRTAPRGMLRRLHDSVDRTRYRFQQWSIAAAMGTGAQFWHRMLSPRHPPPDFRTMTALVRRFNELMDRDVENVERGYYPRELLFRVPILSYMRAAPEVLGDVPFILRRHRARKFVDLPRNVDLDEYPKYYRQNFHWQTHGWLSPHSARVYDIGVDFLFWGATDAMRRMVIPPLVDDLGTEGHPRILDVACGTGRFLKQLSTAFPRARLEGIDLSPFYVERARREAPDARVTVTVENAEALPFRDSTFDAVTCIFLFHELPRATRRNVWREMFRTVKPGGRIVIADSPQASDPDAGEYEQLLRLFPELYHEPYFRDYVNDPLHEALAACGFEVEGQQRFLVTKVIVARRPRV